MDLVEIDQLKFAYGSSLVLDIEQLRIQRGEKLFLRGASGSGKSTLLGLITGTLLPTSGSIKLLGRNLCELTASGRDLWRGQHCGYIFQQFNLLSYLSVAENMALACRVNVLRRERAVKRFGSVDKAVAYYAEALGMSPWLSRPVTQLSVGQQQRVAAARALMGDPELLVADEPTSALDQDHRRQFIEHLNQEASRGGMAVLFVSHDRELARFFDRDIDLVEINRCRK